MFLQVSELRSLPVRHHVSTDEAGCGDADDSGKVVLLLGKIETSLILGDIHG
jgi:hypothetical protein